MLQITISEAEQWDEIKQEFIVPKEQTLQLEHSLAAISKWESRWCKPFLSKQEMTAEETIDYVRCMTITQNVNPAVYGFLSDKHMRQINDYIGAPMTATWISENRAGKGNSEQITSELIYYWMISLNIPIECQEWHLNRLFMLIRVCDIKNRPPKKMNRKDIMRRNAAINEARKKKLNTKG